MDVITPRSKESCRRMSDFVVRKRKNERPRQKRQLQQIC